MPRLWMVLVVLFMVLSCDQEKTSTAIPEKTEFPDDFLGIYKGDLDIVTSNGSNPVPMEFHLLATANSSKYAYKIFYGKERLERAYNLIQTSNPHIYEVDENNGIIIPTAYSNNTLFSTYEVAGNLLNCTEVFHNDRLEFMITMSRQIDTATAGQTDGFTVKSYPISVMQKAVLYKVQNSSGIVD